MAARATSPTTETISALAATSHYCTVENYPEQQDWLLNEQYTPAQPARSGTPLIRQIRNGQVIATYNSLGKSGCYQPENNDVTPDPGCGVFSRGFGRNWQEGDLFEIYPAIYEGEDQQPWIGPAYTTHFEYDMRTPTIPENITLRGITVDGQRPLLRLSASGAFYNTLGQSLINASTTDPNFTIWMTGSYSHDAYYGHTFKSRAQVNLLEGNYFQGGVGNEQQAEAYLIDLPEGGRALLRNNLLIKKASGDGSNGALLTYAVEGAPTGRAQSLVIEHNTFIAYAKTYDGSHLIYPLFTPYQSDEGSSTHPFAKISVNNNIFAGFCGTKGRTGYRGDAAWIVDFDDLNADFSPKDKTVTGNEQIIHRPGYRHQSSHQLRKTAVTGAFD